ncbi:MAG: M23 family metallopeptidase [bacterium]
MGLGLFHVTRYAWKSFAIVIIYGFGKPLKWFGQSVLKTLLVPFYRLYHRVKQNLEGVFAGAKNTWLYPLTTRYLIHVAIVGLALIVTSNSVFASEIKDEEFGSNTLLSTFYNEGYQEQNLSEYAISAPAQSLSSVTKEGALDKYHRPGSTAEAERQLLAVARNELSGEALARANIPTTALAGTPRDKIVDYTVLGGDTLSTIASQFAISTDTLRWANNFDERALIKPEQVIKIPPVSGVLYTVKSGDTIEKIAEKYKAEVDKILEFNQLADARAIEVGNEIMVPGGEIEKPKPAPVTTSYLAYSAPRPASAAVSGGNLQWPTTGRKINQGVRYGHIAIDIDTNRSPVYASESGTVVRTNWGSGYGNNIIINHGGGVETLYAHLSKSYVSVGTSVSRGETIGISGCTGWCTGDHLHFEVWVNGRKVNPFNYL